MYFSFARLSAVLSLFLVTINAARVFESSSLDACQSNSSFTASLFNIVFTPDNRTLTINLVGDSSVTGNVTFRVYASAYGYRFLDETINPCTLDLPSLCPISQFQTSFDSTFHNVSTSIIGSIPGIAYEIPDLDALVTVYMYAANDKKNSVACVQARLSNGKTVDQTGVRWATALIGILGLASAGIVSSLGFANTAAHMMLYALAMFNYFQAVAIIGLCAVPLPPIVQSWTLDMSWSIGVINVKFLQKFATWYQIATGGTPATVLTTISSKSVQVAKRALSTKASLAVRDAVTSNQLYKRATSLAGTSLARRTTQTTDSGSYIVTGIQRMAYLEHMESTNLFFTSLTWYCIFVMFSLLAVTAFKYGVDLAIKMHWISHTNPVATKVRTDWRITLKGIIFRLILIGYPPMMILCLWEFTQNDSPAEIFLAVIFFFGMSAALIWAAFKVFTIGRRSETIYKTSAFSLYADGTVLRKWGFLYTQFKASAYFYVIPMLVYTLVKAVFVGLAQKSGETQAIALILIEAAALIGASVYRPWMDKTTNNINLIICIINFLNAIFLLIFTDIFNGPGLLIGVLGVVFFILNVVFALVLLIIILSVTTLSFLSKNPDTKYLPVADNRASFIKSQTALTTELDALGATARGDRDSSYIAGEEKRMSYGSQRQVESPDPYHNDQRPYAHDAYNSPLNSSLNSPSFAPPPGFPLAHHEEGSRGSLTGSARSTNGRDVQRLGSPASFAQSQARSLRDSNSSRPSSKNGNAGIGNSPWQRGAGYS